MPEEGGRFSVCSAYKVLVGAALLLEGVHESENGIFANLWKSPAPSKAVAFSWMARSLTEFLLDPILLLVMCYLPGSLEAVHFVSMGMKPHRIFSYIVKWFR